MQGNLWEWGEDCYVESYVEAGEHAATDPVRGEGGCSRRVLRGGSFVDVPRDLRSAVRHGFSPGDRLGAIGFRCVRGSVRQPTIVD